MPASAGAGADGCEDGAVDARTVLLAPDKFKGCLTASEVADALATGIRDVSAEVRIRTVPVADGGDGTVAALLARG